MKKIGLKKGVKRILASILLIFFCYEFWEVGVSEFVPWTRTWFINHQSFEKVLYDRNCFGGVFFLEEIPLSADEMKYYWHQQFVEKFAAYSMFVGESDYDNLVEERWIRYQENLNTAEKVTYTFQEGNYCYIEDSEMYERYFSFVNEVLHNPGSEGEYYILVINECNAINGTCYNGVIINDTTMEIVEFSAEIRPENL